MAAKFEVDFSEALRQLAAFQTQAKTMGAALDQLQAKAGQPALASGKLIRDMHKFYTELENKLVDIIGRGEAVDKQLQNSRNAAQALFSRMAADNLKATVQAQAYNGELKELERLLKDTSAKSTFVKWAEKTANLSREMAEQNRHLAEALKQTGTAESKLNAELKARLATEQKLISAGVRQEQVQKELKQQLDLLSSSTGKANSTLRAQISETVRAQQEETKLVGKLGEARRAYDSLQGGLRSQIAVQDELNRGLSQSATFQQREQNLVNELRRRHESLTGGLAEQAAQLRVLNQVREKEITELTRQRAKIEELKRSLASLSGGEQEEIVRLNAKIAARKKAIQEDGRAAVVMEELSAAAARLIVSEQRQKAAIEAKNKATIEEARALQQMTAEEAKAIARSEALAAANKKQAEVTLDEARAAHGMSKAQRELTQNREREIERLNRLKSQKDLLNSAYGQELAALQRQIGEQQRYNRLLAMSTAELLGFTNAQRQATTTLNMGSQSAAMLRAGLSGLHTSIGMYTSSTIIAASATYALASALRSTVAVGAEFTAAMAKADAIMSSSEPKWLPTSMDAMEAQVRALGQSTVYTASEVAAGLVELGQAGLSASESITALKPSLDLALIGGISMAQSADIATNVMMTFGMEAKDLTGIVDVLAQAATDSNTNVEQLANALTYAGPAAHTAGISMLDTVAAIEALSNTGIKASRAGTGLRRLFVSLLNPTEKGAAMLDKYGIAVQDAEGNTRGLVDILGQLNKALHNMDVSEAERLGAVQDLVGVYATSPVAALIGQAGDNGNFERLRSQLDEAGGAAERMREKIENSLKFDWKQVASTFEELQLQLFDTHEYRLREMTASLTKYLQDLSKPFKEIQNEDGTTTVITQLDLLIERATVAGEAIAYAVGGVLAYKMASGTGAMFAALATDAKALTERVTILATRMGAASASSLSLSTVTASMTTVFRTSIAVMREKIATMGMLGAAAWGSAKALQGLAAAASLAMRALGWAGVLYGLYSAFSTVFSADNEKSIANQKNEVDDLKSSYEQLKAQIEQTSLARERDALRQQIGNDQAQIGALGERNLEISRSIRIYEESGADVPLALTSELEANERRVSSLGKAIDAAGESLGRLSGTQLESMSLADQAMAQAQELVRLREAEANAQRAYEAAEGRMRLKEKDAWDEAKAALQDYLGTMRNVASNTDNLVQKSSTLADNYRHMLEQQEQALAAERFDKQATAAEKLLRVQEQIAEKSQQVDAAQEAGDPGALQRRMDDLLELRKLEQELRLEVQDQAAAYWDAYDAFQSLTMSEEEQLLQVQQALAAAAGEWQLYYAMREQGSLTDIEYLELETELLKRMAGLRQKFTQLTKPETEKKRGKTDAERAAEKAQREAEQRLNQAQSTYDSLRKEFDPLGASLDEIREKTAQLDLLLANGKITVEQRAKALSELKKAHYDLTLEQDKNYQALEKLREAYATSPFSSTLQDAIELNRLLKEGAVSMAEYTRLSERMRTRSNEEALNGAPEPANALQNSASTPFGEYVSTELERAEGIGWYNKREADLYSGYQDDNASITQQFEARRLAIEAEELMEIERVEKLKALEEEKNAALLAANQKFAAQSQALEQSRLQYAQQMEVMTMASMAGSLSNIFGMVAAVGEEATTAQKAAFVAQKALAVAQILMYTHLAAARAPAEGGIFGLTVAEAILAQGYASAGLVAALSIGQLVSGESSGSSGGGSSFAGMYDSGGYIPSGQYGVVGEYGPEIVHGPANVTSRKETAKQLGSGGEYNITLAPQITVESKGGNQGSPEDIKTLVATVKTVVMSTLAEQTRPNGALDTWIRNQRKA